MRTLNPLTATIRLALVLSLLGPAAGLAATSDTVLPAASATDAAPPAPAAETPSAEAWSDAEGGGATTLDAVNVTGARRREEAAQDVPIPLTVLDRETLTQSGVYNVSRLQTLAPSLQFYSSNPRNTAVNIRGLGQPYGLTNDGIEPGVGFYVDGVLYARPASTTLDFIDVERIEVLRGPQGTLFGKNTTAGAILVTTRRPSFSAEADLETSVGSEGFLQAKASLSGPLSENLAARLSFSGTQRDGVVRNVLTGRDLNELDNLGFRGQLLFLPTENLEALLAVDFTRQRPEGYAQVLAGVSPTFRGTPGFSSSLYGIGANPNAIRAATSGGSSPSWATPRRTSTSPAAKSGPSTG